MNLNNLEKIYKLFVKEVKTEEWCVSKNLLIDILNFYSIKIPKGMDKCNYIRREQGKEIINGSVKSVSTFKNIFKAIYKLKEIEI